MGLAIRHTKFDRVRGRGVPKPSGTHCAVYEDDLKRFWPPDEEDREATIAEFAKKYGFRLRFYHKGLCAIFDKWPRAYCDDGGREKDCNAATAGPVARRNRAVRLLHLENEGRPGRALEHWLQAELQTSDSSPVGRASLKCNRRYEKHGS